ncbi:sulfotransferase [Acetohalobium arabaticum]|uniref:Sulfotransferase n=1 Tax=Acetohalobium arabaticum (strain ATCC 49924 / DSM 5501 / Z-7288) TaxID=574087 RepID=D9QTS7_ACEAZ|nr:sulfotransferase [Acetohalobium arabaticum]ADL13648.1 hypothetical protein Acear_2162 [Acetohalobium arabaticum DSM 5501]
MKQSKLSKLLSDIKKVPYRIDEIRMKAGLLGFQEWQGIDKYFIISTGRTGTKFFAKFLDEFSDIYSIHEPEPDSTLVRLAIDYARRKISKQNAIEKVEQIRRAMCKDVKRKKASSYIESNNRLFSLIPVLREVFEDIKIIHIVRDGRDYVRSGMSRDWYVEEDDAYRLQANYFEEDKYYNQWTNMTRFEKISWMWQKKDKFIYRSVKKADDSITVKFEDIFKDEDYKGLYRIAEYINLPENELKQMIDKMMNKRVNSTKEYAIPHWTEWNQKLRNKFDNIAGEHMKKYYNYNWNN